MARTVAIDIIARDRASKTFSVVAKNADLSAKRLNKIDKSTKTFSGLKKAALGAGLSLGGLALVAKKGINLYSQFDATLRQVGIQTGGSTKKLEKLAIAMGQDTVFSAQDAAEAMLELAKSGMSAAVIQGGALQSTLKLAAAGGLDLASAAAYMSNSMNAFGLKSKDTNQIVTALAGGANASTASVESLGLALAQSSAGARNAGLSLNQTVGVLAAFDNAGIKGSDAGTSLKTMLQRLIPSTDKAKSAMENLGIKFVDAHGKFKSITAVAQTLHDKLGPLTQAQKAQALQTIFGSDATRAASILTREGAKGLEKYISATRNSGAANKLAKSRMKGLSGAIENLRGSAETTAIIVGKTLSPAVADVARFIANRVLPPIGSFVQYLSVKIPAAIKVVEKPIKGALVGAFNAVKPAALAATGFLGDFFDGLTKPKIPKHASTVQDIIDVQTGIKGNTAGQKAGLQVKKIFDAILSPQNIDIKKVSSLLGSAVLKAFDYLATQANELGQKLVALMGKIPWKTVATAVGDALFQALSVAGQIITKLTSAFIAIMGKVDWVSIGIAIGKQVPTILAGLAVGILNFDLGGLLKGLGRHWQEVLFAIVGLAFTPAKWVGKIAELLDKIPIVGPLLKWMLLAAKKGADKIRDVAWGLMKAFGRGVLAGIRDIFPGLGSGIERGIKGFSFEKALNFLKAKGKALMKGLGDGIASLTEDLGRLVGRVIGRLVDPFANAGRWLVGKGKNVITGLLDGAKSAWGAVSTWVGGIGQKILNAAGNVARLLWSKGSNIIEGLWGGMKDALGKPLEWVRDHIFDPIKGAVKTLFGIHSPSRVMHELGGHVTNGFINGMLSNDPLDIARGMFGSLPKVLRGMVEKGVLEAGQLSKKGLDALKSAGWSAPASGLGHQFGLGLFGNNEVEGQGTGPGGIQGVARQWLPRFGWSDSEFSALNALVNGESGWNPNAANPTSSAYGLFQFLDSTWASYGKKTSDPLKQLDYGLQYIKSRYGSPSAAYAAWSSRSPHWYAKGTDGAAPGWAVVGEKGPELVNLRGGEQILSNPQSRGLMAYASGTSTKLTAKEIARKVAEEQRKTLSTARGFASDFREKLPANAMKFQVQQVANVIKEQIGKAFKGDKAAFLYQWIDKAADSAIGKIPGRMAEVGKGLINHTIAYIDGGNQLDKLGERFGRIYQAVRDNFAGPRERAVLGRVRDFNGKLSSLARQRDRIKNQLAQAAEFSAGVASGAKDYANITNLTVSTPKSLITELEKKVKNIGSFNYNLRALSKRGLSTDLLNQLIAAGPEAGGALAQKLMKSGKGQINRLNYLQGRINRNSVALGSTATNIQFGGSARSNFVGTKQQQERALEKAMDKLADRLAESIADSFGDAELRLSESSGRVLARIVSKQAVKDRRR